mmetsp:Transcript_983/g.2747  ORF Transcript_983/g.2747 Transcript_983/m.2747 type:complete len:212 (+) Transcript_983:241-876(+)
MRGRPVRKLDLAIHNLEGLPFMGVLVVLDRNVVLDSKVGLVGDKPLPIEVQRLLHLRLWFHIRNHAVVCRHPPQLLGFSLPDPPPALSPSLKPEVFVPLVVNEGELLASTGMKERPHPRAHVPFIWEVAHRWWLRPPWHMVPPTSLRFASFLWKDSEGLDLVVPLFMRASRVPRSAGFQTDLLTSAVLRLEGFKAQTNVLPRSSIRDASPH